MMKTVVSLLITIVPLLPFWRIQGYSLGTGGSRHEALEGRRRRSIHSSMSLRSTTTRTTVVALSAQSDSMSSQAQSSSSSTTTTTTTINGYHPSTLRHRIRSWFRTRRLFSTKKSGTTTTTTAPLPVVSIINDKISTQTADSTTIHSTIIDSSSSSSLPSSDQSVTMTTRTTDANPAKSREITRVQELDELWKLQDAMKVNPKEICSQISVKGDTQIIGSKDHPQYIHPVVQVIHDRRRRRLRRTTKITTTTTTTGGKSVQSPISSNNQEKDNDVYDDDDVDDDGLKIALVVEGGGMRGCVTAGMVCAIDYLGLRDTVDVVYGSSAGSVIGASFITGQLPWFGPETYYDQLTSETAGKDFINTDRLFRALGLGLLHPRLIKDVIVRRNAGKPVLDLRYLLERQVQNEKRLDWDTFEQRQQPPQSQPKSSSSSQTPLHDSPEHNNNKSTKKQQQQQQQQQRHQPLKVVASALKSEQSIVLNYDDGHFSNLEELAQCMRASCLLPGIAGPVANILKTTTMTTMTTTTTKKTKKNSRPKFIMRNNLDDPDYEPLADALVYAPIPYEEAFQDGATHMIVLRSKPDGVDVIGKGGSLGEKLVWSRFFLRKNKLPNIYKRLTQQLHKRLYAHNILELNEAARIMDEEQSSSSSSSLTKTKKSTRLPPTLTVALAPGFQEIPRLEADREAIFEGVRQGFARAYDALVEDPAERGNGYDVAKVYFPDEILDYSPLEMLQSSSQDGDDSTSMDSAFERYLKTTGTWPVAWAGHDTAPVRKIYNDEPVQTTISQKI